MTSIRVGDVQMAAVGGVDHITAWGFPVYDEHGALAFYVAFPDSTVAHAAHKRMTAIMADALTLKGSSG